MKQLIDKMKMYNKFKDMFEIKEFDIGYSVGICFVDTYYLIIGLPFQIGHSRYRKANGIPWWSKSRRFSVRHNIPFLRTGRDVCGKK